MIFALNDLNPKEDVHLLERWVRGFSCEEDYNDENEMEVEFYE